MIVETPLLRTTYSFMNFKNVFIKYFIQVLEALVLLLKAHLRPK